MRESVHEDLEFVLRNNKQKLNPKFSEKFFLIFKTNFISLFMNNYYFNERCNKKHKV